MPVQKRYSSYAFGMKSQNIANRIGLRRTNQVFRKHMSHEFWHECRATH